MSPGRLSKRILRHMVVAWREQPGHHEIEALEANTERVGLVVRTRWAIVIALVIFSVLAAGIYTVSGHAADMAEHMVVPAFCLLLVCVYNAYYQANYRRFGNIAAFNVVQLLADIAVVTVLVYYSGGVYSWFDAMYYLFVLEAAMILPTSRGVWAVAATAMAAYAGVVAADCVGLLPHMDMPFVDGSLARTAPYVAVRALWTLTVLAGAAGIGTVLMARVRAREALLIERSVRDDATGLYNRAELRRELGREVRRSERFGRGLSVVLADVDHMERFNATFGFEAGTRMLVEVAGALVAAQDTGEDETLAFAGRYGGEEFALLVPEEKPGGSSAGLEAAERLRAAVESLRVDDRSVTVSVGLASFPADGRTPTDLFGAADAALSRASEEGGNRVARGRGTTPAAAGIPADEDGAAGSALREEAR